MAKRSNTVVLVLFPCMQIIFEDDNIAMKCNIKFQIYNFNPNIKNWLDGTSKGKSIDFWISYKKVLWDK